MALSVDTTTCQVCGSPDVQPALDLLDCPRCDFRFAPVQEKPNSGNTEISGEESFPIYLKHFLSIMPAGSKILLIGENVSKCSLILEQKGYEVHQVEISKIDLSERVASASFDGCFLLNALEHTKDLNYLLASIRSSLLPEGSLFLVTPTTDDIPKSANRKSLHLYQFNRQNLHSFLLKSGFQNVLTFPENYRSGESFTMITVCKKGELPKQREKISVIVPVYNEKLTFATMMQSLVAKKLENADMEILIVESNSTDGTRQEVQKYEGHTNIVVIYEDKPQGKGHAVRAGLEKSTGEIVLIQDADLEYRVQDYDDLLAPLLRYERMFVLGSRHTGNWKMREFGSKKTLSAYVNFGHVLFTYLINVTHGSKLKDPFTMYKVFRKECLNGLKLESDGFDLDWEIVIKLLRKKYYPLEVPVSYKSRSFTEGKKIHLLKDPLRGLRALWRYRFSRFELTPGY